MNNAVSRLPLLADRLFDTPLLVHGRKLRTVVAVLGARMGLSDDLTPEIKAAAHDKFLAAHSDPVDGAAHGIAVIPVHGTLVQRGDSLDAMSGMRSYESIRCEFREALNDGSVSAILLDIDSGGGEVAGCFDLVDEIAAARGKKPIFAFANEHAYSAAYAIACAADKIYLPRTGGVGSIGVVAVHMEQSGFDEMMGVTYTPIYAGARKIDGWAHGPLAKEAKEEFQKSVNSAYSLFTETVARNRGMALKDVKATEAGCYSGSEAVEAGLADAIGSFDEVIGMIVADIEARDAFATAQDTGQGGREAVSGRAGENREAKDADMALNMLKKKRAEANEPSDEEKKKAATPGGDPEKDEEGDGKAEGEDTEEEAADKAAEEDEPEKEDAAKTAASDAAEIMDLCVLFGNPGMASDFVRQGAKPEAVRQSLLKKRNEQAAADRAAGTSIVTANDGKTAPESNAVVDDMKRRFLKK